MSTSQTTIPSVDLVIAIDTSTSMKKEAVGLSDAAEAAIEAAKASCPSDLRVAWLGLEGTWKGTQFDRTVRDYLTQECKVADSDLRSRKDGEVAQGGAKEDGARTIEDLSNHFDWRPEAKRAIFYLSDEALDGGGSRTTEADIEAANLAIRNAIAAGVAIHTYFGTSRSKNKEALQQEFARVSKETGGHAFNDQNALSGFTDVLETIICATKVHVPPTPVEMEADYAEPSNAEAEIVEPVASPLSESGAKDERMIMTESSNHDDVNRIIRNHSLAAGGISLVMWPLVDILATGSIQLLMIYRLCVHYDREFSTERVRAILAALIGGAGLGLLMSSFVKLIPNRGVLGFAIPTSLSAGGLTFAIGKIFERHFEEGGTLDSLNPGDVQEEFNQAVQQQPA